MFNVSENSSNTQREVVNLNSVKKYTERGEEVRRLQWLWDGYENEGDLVAKKKVVGKGTCEGFDSTNLNTPFHSSS